MAPEIMPRTPVPMEPGHTIASGLAVLALTLVMPSPAVYALGAGSVLLIGLGLWDLRKPRRRRRNPRSVVAELDREQRRRQRPERKA